MATIELWLLIGFYGANTEFSILFLFLSHFFVVFSFHLDRIKESTLENIWFQPYWGWCFFMIIKMEFVLHEYGCLSSMILIYNGVMIMLLVNCPFNKASYVTFLSIFSFVRVLLAGLRCTQTIKCLVSMLYLAATNIQIFSYTIKIIKLKNKKKIEKTD